MIKPHFALKISTEVAAWTTLPAASNVPPMPLVSLMAREQKAKSPSSVLAGMDNLVSFSPFSGTGVAGVCVESPISSPACPMVAATSTKLPVSERVDATV